MTKAQQKAVDNVEKSAAFLRGWFGIGPNPAVAEHLQQLDESIRVLKRAVTAERQQTERS